MSSAEMDHRAVRLALGLTIAGALMLTAGVATWLITAVARVRPGVAASDLRLASLGLLAGGAVCGLAMGLALAAAGRAPTPGQPGGPRFPAGDAALTGDPLDSPVPAPPASPAPPGPRSLMTPPLAGPPPLAAPSGDPAPADRVWWRAAHRPGSGWDDTSEEWLRSLRGPAIHQPPPHSAE